MSLRYIFGFAHSGKTNKILAEIAENLSGDKNLIYIVPEQFTLQSEADIINTAGKSAISQVQVLSLNRLSYRIFSELGFNREKTVDNVGKNMLIRKLATDYSDDFLFYAKSADKHGFIEEISQIITEFYRYEISPDILRIVAEKPQTNKNLSDKLTDILKIYEGYNNFLQDGCISADDSMDYLAQIIDGSEYIKSAFIWIDGFFGFTPQELKVITQLIKNAKEVTVSLTVNENSAYYNNLSEFDLFYETKHTVNSLTKAAREQKAGVSSLFLKDGKRCESAFLTSHANIYDEAENAAASILHLVRDKNYRFRDIAISVSNLDGYQKILKGVFGGYEIPVFVDAKEDILSHPLTELIRSAVDIICRRWSFESVFRFIKTSMLPIDKNDLFDFENYCLEFGVSEMKWSFKEWTFGFNTERYDKEKINEIKIYIQECLSPFTNGVKRGAKLSVKEFSLKIFEILSFLNVTETLTKWIYSALGSGNNLLARKHRQIWGLICHVFDEMVNILGNEEMSFKEFSKVLDSGLQTLNMGLIPPSKDQIIIGDINRTRLPEIKALFVLGMNDGALTVSEGGALLDSERLSMRENGIKLSDSARQKTRMAELYIHSLFSKPSGYLFVSYPSGNLDGKAMYPSPVINTVKDLYPKCTESFLPENYIKTKKTMLREAGEILRSKRLNESINDNDEALLRFYQTDAEYEKTVKTMDNLVKGEKASENLSAETVGKLYGNEIISNVSRLESYIECPFSYFVKYNLNAQQRRVYQVDFVDLGNLFHAVLEEFSKLLEINKISWFSLTDSLIKKYVSESLELIKNNDSREIFGASGANIYLLTRVKRVAEKSIWALARHIELGDFVPQGMELRFKSDAITGITVDIGADKKFILTGRIDRVDIMDLEGKAYVKIIDYKTGAKKFSYGDIYYGMQLQLMLYLDSFIKMAGKLPERKPGGVFYFNINDPVLNSSELNFNATEMDEEKISQLNEKILSKFKMSGLSLAEIDIAKGMDNGIADNAGKRSRVVGNVQLSKNEETGLTFTKSSAVATMDEFSLLQEYANYKIAETGSDILRGKIDKKPYKKTGSTGCDYCSFSAICKFDLIAEANKYRNFKKYGSVAEVIGDINEVLNEI
ncbi:MAG: PD-(D/E)XK nuclease family protein [Clostridiales bacterium]|jgi:ATP-dependent helicase/nuclease subunit B|nr:PD-(D/E)XK nuclease family protein [Clostridiales bacterium]